MAFVFIKQRPPATAACRVLSLNLPSILRNFAAKRTQQKYGNRLTTLVATNYDVNGSLKKTTPKKRYISHYSYKLADIQLVIILSIV